MNEELMKRLRAAAKDLAELASYSEITGQIHGTNREPIRISCDAVFDIERELQDIDDAAEAARHAQQQGGGEQVQVQSAG